jgi:hypothetical protein
LSSLRSSSVTNRLRATDSNIIQLEKFPLRLDGDPVHEAGATRLRRTRDPLGGHSARSRTKD